MKVLLVLGLLALGCGAEGGGGDAGAEAVCRPPAGCAPVLRGGLCDYDCRGAGAGSAVCIPLPDGGVADHGQFTFGVPPAALVGVTPYVANLQSDRQNCNRCGRRCTGREVCGISPFDNTVTCYVPP